MRQSMEMLLRCLVFFEMSCLANSFNVYEPVRNPAWNYFGYSWVETPSSVVFRKPMSAMVDLTNNLGVAILQDYAYSRSNFAFSPYGVASVLVVLYEGARSESARQIHRAVKFPWDRDITRIGFRDIHRHLRTYFSHEGYLSGITLSKEGSTLKPEYKRILRFYGYDVDVDPQEKGGDLPSSPPTEKLFPSSSSSTSSATTVSVSNATEGFEIASTTEGATEGTKTEPTEYITMMSTTNHKQFTTVTVENNEESFQTSTFNTSDVSTTENAITLPAESTQNLDAEPTTSENPTSTSDLTNKHETPHLTTEITSSETEFETESDPYPITTNSDLFLTESTTVSDLFPSGDQETTTAKDVVTSLAEEATISMRLNDSDEFAAIKELEAFNDFSLEEHNQRSMEDELDNGMLIPQSLTDHNYTHYSTKSENEVNSNDIINSTESVKKIEENYDLNSSQIQENIENTVAAGGDPRSTPETLPDFLPSLKTAADNGRRSTRNRRLISAQEPFSQVKFNFRNRHSRICPSNDAGNENGVFTANRVYGSKRVTKRSYANPQPKTSFVDFQTFAVVSGGKRDRTHSRKGKRTLSDFLKIPVVPDLSLQLQNGMFDSHVSKDYDLYRALPRFLFLVDGAIDTPVPMMTYTNIFSFAYIPRLHCKALEFPLDDERYKLLIILPVERRGLRQLIYDLTAYPLRNIIDALRPARVKAMVPTFMVEGFVILTPTLQKLGIWDVFDPRKSDLSGMTTDPDLYVRNIEQSVTVVIRNYVEILDIQTRTMAARDVNDDFIASHPFLYFVMDTTTNVALMAGQMLDPLNSRIY